jgi:cytidyltransferase-like protein
MDAILRRVVIVTGGFDPCHQGHISYLRSARSLGDWLVVGLNSDSWLIRKKNLYFMSWDERASVLAAIRYVDQVIKFDDRDGSARDAIRITRDLYPSSEIIFANGGDRTADEIPEMDQRGVIFEFGVGGANKENSSSDILRRYAYGVLCRHEQETASIRCVE